MDKRLEKAKAAAAARAKSFPVLVLDGSVQADGDAFRATLYGADGQPIGQPMTQAEVDATPAHLIGIGLRRGAIIRDADGNLRPAPVE